MRSIFKDNLEINIFDTFIISCDSPEFKGKTLYYVSHNGDSLHLTSNYFDSRKFCVRESAMLEADELKLKFGYDFQVVMLGG